MPAYLIAYQWDTGTNLAFFFVRKTSEISLFVPVFREIRYIPMHTLTTKEEHRNSAGNPRP